MAVNRSGWSLLEFLMQKFVVRGRPKLLCHSKAPGLCAHHYREYCAAFNHLYGIQERMSGRALARLKV